MQKKKVIKTYVLLGVLLGLFFPIVSYIICFFLLAPLENYSFSLSQLHIDFPLLWVIDTAPIVLALVSYYVGAQVEQSYSRYTSYITSINSDLNIKNQQLRDHVKEKEILLQEIHHRVKNNLQVVISLMRLKMNELNDEESIMHYRETMSRVMVMGLIHEKMYRSDDLSNIDLQSYFNELSRDILNSYSFKKDVNFSYDITLTNINIDLVVPLALIFNELLTNSLKHAFDETLFPEIEMTLCAKGDKIEFHYGDNGQWREQKDTSSFGLELIDSLVDQLKGKLVFRKEPTTYDIEIAKAS